MNKTWAFIEKHVLTIFLLSLIMFLLLWNLDRWLPICPYGTIPGVLGLILAIIVTVKKRLSKARSKRELSGPKPEAHQGEKAGLEEAPEAQHAAAGGGVND